MILECALGQARDMFTNLGRTEVDVSTAYTDLNTTWESISRVSGKSKEPLDAKLLHYRGVFQKEGLVRGDELLKVNIVPRRSLIQISIA
jgi:hypothetical protein